VTIVVPPSNSPSLTGTGSPPPAFDLTGGELHVKKIPDTARISIQGQPQAGDPVVIEPLVWQQFRVMEIDANLSVLLADITIQNGGVVGPGGGIDSAANILELDDCIVTGNLGYNGGGLYQSGGTLRLFGTHISFNHAGWGTGGGGVAGHFGFIVAKPSVTQASSIDHNSSEGGGGGFSLFGTGLTLIDTPVTANTADTNGGGISSGPKSKTETVISGPGSVISYNHARTGGGIFSQGNVEVENGASVRSNSAKVAGGGIDQSGGWLTVDKGADVSYNVAGNVGGGIYTGGGATTGVDGATVTHNRAPNGGGIYQNAGSLTITDSTVSYNTPGTHDQPSAGGAVYVNIGSATIDHSLLAHNAAGITKGSGSAGLGGGIYNVAAQLSVSDTTIAYNRAYGKPSSPGLGGGIYTAGGSVQLSFDTLAGNRTYGGAPASGQNIYTSGVGSTVVGGSIITTTAPLTDNCNMALTSGGPNLDWDGLAGDTCGVDSVTPQSDPLLGGLNDNGGLTQTMALLDNSPALHQGSSCPSNDQRHYTRVPTGCDLGAFESTE
jgi:hypothetical protein